MNTYTAQNTVRLSATISLNSSGAPVDPTTVGLQMKLPDGTVTDLASSVVKDAAGAYHCDYQPITLGLHMYEWIGTGGANVARRGQFLVTQTTF